jgi:hypothetical protein
MLDDRRRGPDPSRKQSRLSSLSRRFHLPRSRRIGSSPPQDRTRPRLSSCRENICSTASWNIYLDYSSRLRASPNHTAPGRMRPILRMLEDWEIRRQNITCLPSYMSNR